MRSTAIVVLLLVGIGCNARVPAVRDISPEQLLSNPPTEALILDVRTPKEFRSGHVPGAVNIPHDELGMRLAEIEPDRGRPIVVYCERGGRAGKAASLLLDAGFEDIRHLEGDMSEWRAKNRPTETNPGSLR